MASKTTTPKEDGLPKSLSIQGFVDGSFKGPYLNKDGAITRAEVFELLGPMVSPEV